MRLEEASSKVINQIWSDVLPQVEQSHCIEDAAQALASALHTTFEESVVISRVFLTLPFSELPPRNREFVRDLADLRHTADVLTDTTPVLSLIGTHGRKTQWCDCHESKGHVGIPLISAEFVGAIPMISRVLGELGVPIAYLDSHDTGIITETVGQKSGLFFVEDASQATDSKGRKIITDQSFVGEHGVKSVFGIAGAYDSGELLVVIVFCEGAIPREVAEEFVTLVEVFRKETAAHMKGHHVFVEA